jgi:hypothetical protein
MTTVTKALTVLITVLVVTGAVTLVVRAVRYQTPYQQYAHCVQAVTQAGNSPSLFCTPP